MVMTHSCAKCKDRMSVALKTRIEMNRQMDTTDCSILPANTVGKEDDVSSVDQRVMPLP